MKFWNPARERLYETRVRGNLSTALPPTVRKIHISPRRRDGDLRGGLRVYTAHASAHKSPAARLFRQRLRIRRRLRPLRVE